MKKEILLFSLMALFVHGMNAQTALPTSWNFSTPPITSPPNGWTSGLATGGTNLTYTGSGTSIGGDNTAARFDATGDFLTIWFAEKAGPISYYIKGTGISPAPAFTGTFSIQESADGIAYSNLKQFTTASPAPGGNMGSANKFVHTPAPTSRYIRFYYTEKLSGSNIALDSVLIKAAPAAATPSMQLIQAANTIVNGSQFVIGNSSFTAFTIKNNGTQQTLNIDSIIISGPASGDYSVPLVPDPVVPGASFPLNLNFNPSVNGSRKAVMKIYNNDPDRNPFIVNLYGIGGSLATEPAAAPANLSLIDVKPFSFKISFNASADAEKYIVLRKTSGNLTETPVDGQSYRVGEYIGAAQVAYIGDSAVSALRPNYILANTEYQVQAFAFNGPAGFENYLTSSSTGNSITTPGLQQGTYYDGINPYQNPGNFVTDLHNKINPHDTVYYGYYAARLVSSWLERDTSNGQKVVNCVYTGLPQIYSGQFLWAASTNTAVLTREHSYCQSWMPTNTPNVSPNWPNASNGKEYPEYNDMHHLFPTHQVNANLKRSDNPLGIVISPTYTSPTGEGKLGTNASGITVYEPRNAHKGDAARALMYMSVCYHGVGGRNWGLPPNANSTSQQSTAVLMDWHLQDPPSALEIARHELIFAQQKNRNPFIDNPDWANFINFSTMQYIPFTGVQGPVDFHGRIATWPNPSADRIFVDASLHFENQMAYEFTDLSGRVVQSGILPMAISEVQLPSEKGAYILRLHGKNGIRNTRVLKD